MSNLFSIGTSALLANQQALATSSHNIANANTDGYSRQRVDFAARQVPGQSGQGVEILSTTRYSDQFANSRLVESSTELAALETSSGLASRLDVLLSDEQSGLAQPLREFMDAIDGLAADPGSVEARVEVLGEAEALAQRFSQIQNTLNQMGREINARMDSSVTDINTLSESIAQLNSEISFSQGGGQPVNDLLDRRDQLINELAQHIDVSTAFQDDGSVNVFVSNGQSLVVGKQAQTLTAVPGATPDDPMRVFAGGSDITGQISGGALGGLLEFRSDVLAPAQQQLTDLAGAIAGAVNGNQAAGTDYNGNPGAALFQTAPDGAGLKVLISDPAQLAAAAGGSPANSGDNTNALALADLLRSPLLGPNSAQEANISMVGRVGAQTRQLQAAATAQTAIVSHHQNLRDDVSGVNLDEEAANIMRYQQSYQAAAQIIATANAMFDALLAAAR